ncbi:MAG: hypothetical protein E6F99_06905 [Actinobacteria bacterium]|nr:MAG: hypothetical protein E6F99_06905 [Actinomycetota bacterium]
MGYWTVVVPAERYAQERLVGNVSLAAVPGPAPGDQVALVAGVEPPVVFGLGTVGRDGRRLPADDLAAGPLPADVFAALAAQAGPAEPVRTWIVGVDLPIEADSAAEAVRRYWSYVRDLGPTELPAYVAPLDDELAMQAYVMGQEAALDPEED